MTISLLVAMDEHRGIGKDNRIPWHLSDDLKRFKSLTMGHHIIMGRKTYESIGKPLPGRTLIVITGQQCYKPASCLVVHSLEEALKLAEHRRENEVFIIGGGEVFAQTLNLANRIYLTVVHTNAHTDVFFPEYDDGVWTEIECSHYPADDKHKFSFTFKTLEKQNPD